MSAYTREPTILPIKRVERKPEDQSGPVNSSEVNKLVSQNSVLFKFPQLFYEIESLCSSIRQMEVCTQKEKERSTDLQSQFAEERSKYQGELNEANRKLQEFAIFLEKTKNELLAHQAKEKVLVSQLKSQLDQINHTRNELQSTKQALALEQQRHSIEVDHFKGAIHNERLQTEALKLEVMKIQESSGKELSQWKEKHALLAHQADKLKSQIQLHLSQEEKLNKQLLSVKTELQKSRVEEQNLVAKIHNYQNKLNETQNEVHSYQHRLKSYASEVERNQNKIHTLESQLNQIRQTLASAQEREKQTHDSYSRLQESLTRMVDELSELKLNKHLLQQELTESKNEIKDLERENLQIQNELKETLEKKASVAVSDGPLGATLIQSVQEIQSLQKELLRLPAGHPEKMKIDEIFDLIIEQKGILDDLFNSPKGSS